MWEAITDPDYVWQPPSASTTNYGAANVLNQYPSVNGTSFAYDPKGNLTSDGIWAFGYDAENRLLTANKTTGGTVAASYAYDPLGRRNHKSGTGVTERYVLIDGDDAVLDYDGGKNPVAFYVPGPAIDEPIVMSTPNGGGTYAHQYFHTNHQGSVIATSDDSGAKQGGPYVYDPYGNCFKGAASCASLGTVPFAFTGQRLDPETGLYYYRARCYSPTLGRFCQTDPVGYEADPNLYTYVGNNPINGTDPNGTCPSNVNCADTEGLGGVQGIDVTNGGIGSSKNGQFSADIGSLLGGDTSPANAQNISSTPASVNTGTTSTAAGATRTAQVELLARPPITGPVPEDEVTPPPSSPTAVPRPTFPYPRSPNNPPGPGFEWKGNGPPGSGRGNWYNKDTGESVHPDTGHAPPVGPHYDWKAPDGNWYRYFPDGRVEPKMIVLPGMIALQ